MSVDETLMCSFQVCIPSYYSYFLSVTQYSVFEDINHVEIKRRFFKFS